MTLWWIALAGISTLRPLRIDEIKVTEGTVTPSPSLGLSIVVPKVRAVSLSPGSAGPQTAELRFRYLGPTDSLAKLDDGESRQQLGLKLRALDACNVVYVMWRIQPKSELAVQVKANPGMSTSRECGAHGYRKLPVRVALPALQPGDRHALRAELREGSVEVFVDNQSVWRGVVGVGDVPPVGPIGIRTDNVRMDFVLAGDGL